MNTSMVHDARDGSSARDLFEPMMVLGQAIVLLATKLIRLVF